MDVEGGNGSEQKSGPCTAKLVNAGLNKVKIGGFFFFSVEFLSLS